MIKNIDDIFENDEKVHIIEFHAFLDSLDSDLTTNCLNLNPM